MRILITVGTMTSPFNRLMQYADTAIAALSTPVTGVCQGGVSQVRPRGLLYRDTLTRAEFDTEIAMADVVICHAGVGTIWTALREGHRPLVVPRLHLHGEHVNDHQVQIVEALHKEGRVAFIQGAEQMRHELLRYERGEVQRGPRLGQDSSRFDKVSAAIAEGPTRATSPLLGKVALRLLGVFGPSIEKLRVG
jgi:UDP-N-acetylglucosamine transferase subunit ALG13